MATLSSGHFAEFLAWDGKRINDSFKFKLKSEKIEPIIKTWETINDVINYAITEEAPTWFNESIQEIAQSLANVLADSIQNQSTNDIEKKINTFYRVLNSWSGSGSIRSSYPLPVLENYVANQKIQNELSAIQVTKNEVEGLLRDTKIVNEQLADFKKDADVTLSLIKKEVGKIGVKEYAEIFENQALEHSNFSWNPIRSGKAQLWIYFAFLVIFGFSCSFFCLDKLFSLKNEFIFTPEVIVHMAGRFLFISLFIFVISFSFKQFRVNMHLFTVNRHRANTLKSFEYLTRSPDPLSPDSYNAILMEVAKAIYEAGQTGYINSNDSNSDMPSIVDMSKIITQPKV